LLTDQFRPNFIPGLCLYKFLYVWLDLELPDGGRARSLGWMYWLPNPLFPFIWYRVAVPRAHPELAVEERSISSAAARSTTDRLIESVSCRSSCGCEGLLDFRR
jgi:hypothetical protein